MACFEVFLDICKRDKERMLHPDISVFICHPSCRVCEGVKFIEKNQPGIEVIMKFFLPAAMIFVCSNRVQHPLFVPLAYMQKKRQNKPYTPTDEKKVKTSHVPQLITTH